MNRERLRKTIDLTKPRIVFMVAITTTIGFFLPDQMIASWPLLLVTLFATFLVGGGASVLNNYLERNTDKLMKRTQSRALPSGVVSPMFALQMGLWMVLLGLIVMAAAVNVLSAFLACIAAFLYVLVYTPMKRVSWLNTAVGAIPGAMPPMWGWTAATGQLEVGAWVLFAILYLWQHPHFFAIAWMYKEEYGKANFKMLPVVNPDGASTVQQVMIHAILLIPVSILPSVLGITGWVYALGACALSLFFLQKSLVFAKAKNDQTARGLLRASIIYLPVLLLLIVGDVML